LELCIDNLTSEFLDPTLDPVLRELMTALYNLLKPVPFNHQQAHSAVKILGKLGGRNRKFAQTPYLLEFHPVSEDIVLQFDVEGQQQDFQIASWVELAARHVRNPAAYNRENAVTFLKQCSLLFVSSRYHSIEQEPVLRNVIKGLFEASIVEEQHDDVVEHIRLLAHEVFRLELQETARKQPKAGKRSSLSLRPSSFIQSIILAMADGMVNSAERMKELFEVIVKDLLAQKKEADDSSDSTSKDSGNIMIQMLFSRSFGLCFEEDWDRKLAGCAGLDILRKQEALEGKWLAESRKLDYVRGLFFVLRDAPKDTPKSLEEVASLLKDVIRQSSVDPQVNPSSMSKLIDMLVLELPSQKTAVRDAAKECIAILAEIKQVSVYDLISSSAKERLLDPASGPIFNKPLRALPFGMQIGNIDAITYLLNLTPSLPEVNEELNRLFHETIALADADDASLIGRQTHHALEVSLRSLRVACLKLLCAAMNCAELFANNQSSLRSRYEKGMAL
jgi:transformation/transcription domain-associated protein